MLPDTDALTPIVARILRIEDITTGDPKKNYLARFRGQLYGDSAEAYDRLAESLLPLEVTPLFRMEDDRHVVLIMPGVIRPRKANPWINLVLFLLTVFSVVLAGALNVFSGPVPDSFGELMHALLQALPSGVPFAASLLAILLAHEFGHYLAGRYHGAHVTLPYFIPFPFSPFGTMGAFIQMKSPPKNRRNMLDIGIAGPLAGLAVAIPVLLYGLSISTVEPIDLQPSQGFILEGNSLLYLLAKYIVFGQWLPQPSSFGDLPPLLYWIRYFFTSQPLPLGGLDVMISPVAWAGWAGLLVTALNLIPAGQLDGGHLVYVLLGSRARKLLPVILVALGLLGLVWSGWWLWAFLIMFLGRVYAEPLDTITKLDSRRRVIAMIGIVIFFLVFTPVPLVEAFVGG